MKSKTFPAFRRDLSFIVTYGGGEDVDDEAMDMLTEIYAGDFRNSEFRSRKVCRLYPDVETLLYTFMVPHD